MATQATVGDGAEAGHEHPPFLAHHFDTPTQQFDSAKLGMWLFLATEVLLFSGLFCAYANYRHNHPEIFVYAHYYLDKTLGGINTIVLICSSLTMAWAVRNAQLNQRKLLITNLILTLLFACGFLGIKFVEYKHKIHSGLLWGTHFQPDHAPGEEGHGAAVRHEDAAGSDVAANQEGPAGHDAAEHESDPAATHESQADVEHGAAETEAQANAPPIDDVAPIVAPKVTIERSKIEPIGKAPEGTRIPGEDGHGHQILARPDNVHIFFGIYFAMTGLHGLHVLAGMTVIGWVLKRSIKGEFGSSYFTPVDLSGLYWHLVDLIWIFLFPLLYLIH